MKPSFVIIFFLGLSVFSYSQKTDNKLQHQLNDVIKGFNGDLGVYVKDIRTGKTVSDRKSTRLNSSHG